MKIRITLKICWKIFQQFFSQTTKYLWFPATPTKTNFKIHSLTKILSRLHAFTTYFARTHYLLKSDWNINNFAVLYLHFHCLYLFYFIRTFLLCHKTNKFCVVFTRRIVDLFYHKCVVILYWLANSWKWTTLIGSLKSRWNIVSNL